jgi:hypothetical protein
VHFDSTTLYRNQDILATPLVHIDFHQALAMSVNSAFDLLAILTAPSIQFVLQRANKKLDASMMAVADVMKGEAEAEIKGVTEEERISRKESFRPVTYWC